MNTISGLKDIKDFFKDFFSSFILSFHWILGVTKKVQQFTAQLIDSNFSLNFNKWISAAQGTYLFVSNFKLHQTGSFTHTGLVRAGGGGGGCGGCNVQVWGDMPV